MPHRTCGGKGFGACPEVDTLQFFASHNRWMGLPSGSATSPAHVRTSAPRARACSRVMSSKGVLPPTIKLTQFQDLPLPGGYAPFSIPKNAKNLQGALAFVNFMLTVESQTSVIKSRGGFPAINWSNLDAALQEQYTSVIAKTVPNWPGGPWDVERNKGWYDNVATNIKQGS